MALRNQAKTPSATTGGRMSETITDVTDTTFERDVLASQVPVLVDYWAEWCPPCKMIGPMLAESAVSYAGRLNVAKVNIDDNPKTPSRYRVRSIPTLMLFKAGQPIATHVGALSRAQLDAFIEANVPMTRGFDVRAPSPTT
jgi:thioredoxin 1